ncbi:flagellar hook-associated protein FlgK [Tropicimonas isoalkanivorans]|uniref:Flagellar hook-associated protein 1 n=1 Tax=Tropicimonas isoalkanivorans TaxID=441112 RepID=A0A1I1KYS7_9RHOB|nr:flagellar hook-associated protein FlgK [Tropicimonas isoalkanivorans]SFC65966.1 flagellar hook-associated protein 1 FlgK [Tropicimonas isoalkanivorans]
MSLSSALSNALSGLTAASRAAEIASANVSNATTPGYARREISLSSNGVNATGAGVQVDGVTRVTDDRASADCRLAKANLANASTASSGWLRIEAAIGLPTEEGSLESRITAFGSALIDAASRPDEDARLIAAADAASTLASHVRSISDNIQGMRMDADSDIGRMVEQLNSNLEHVQTLNSQIFRMSNAGSDISGLLDQRQNVVNSISEIVPVNQVSRDGGQIALYTTGGAILLDGPAAQFEFTTTGTITPDMTLDAGSLSGLSINGNPLNVGAAYDPVGGGKLAAAFEIRDQIAPGAQAELDAFARDLIERFQDPALGTSTADGSRGLFTDDTGAFTAVDEIGVSARIQLHPSVDTALGGEIWRMRDGAGATAQGDVGNSTLLTSLSNRLMERRVAPSGDSAGVERSVVEFASNILSAISTKQNAAEAKQTFEAARVETLETELARSGVDTDDEMQKLLLIEQAYAANARVMQTVDRLMQNLLEI